MNSFTVGNGVYTEMTYSNGNIANIRWILDNPKNEKMDPTTRGFRVLHAAEMGREDLVDLLLRDGPCNAGLDSALNTAAEKGFEKVVITLLHDKTIPIDAMRRASEKAANMNNGRIVEILNNEINIQRSIWKDGVNLLWSFFNCCRYQP